MNPTVILYPVECQRRRAIDSLAMQSTPHIRHVPSTTRMIDGRVTVFIVQKRFQTATALAAVRLVGMDERTAHVLNQRSHQTMQLLFMARNVGSVDMDGAVLIKPKSIHDSKVDRHLFYTLQLLNE